MEGGGGGRRRISKKEDELIEVEPILEEEDGKVSLELIWIKHKMQIIGFFGWIFSLSISKKLGVMELWIIVSVIGYIFKFGLRQKKEGETSAYSLFNEGFREIEGTLNVNRIEQNILGATLHSHNNNDNNNNNSLEESIDQEEHVIEDNVDFDDDELQEAIRRSLTDSGMTRRKFKEERKKQKKLKPLQLLLNKKEN